MSRFFPSLTATRLQITTYLFGIALFSIAFLVFLNSSISFVVTYVIGQHDNVGDAVGTLGFADELLALIACPLWGLLSDKIGVRTVAVVGYCVIGLSLMLLVQSSNVYPQLLLGRLGFSIGGAACSTMVTAVLPAMVARRADEGAVKKPRPDRLTSRAKRVIDREMPSRSSSYGHATTASVSSELTITPQRYSSNSQTRRSGWRRGKDQPSESSSSNSSTSQLAGFVGMFTGLGALIALIVFLPLPAYLHDRSDDWPQAVRSSFYTVGAIAFCVAVFIFFGLRNLPGEEDKSITNLWRSAHGEESKTDQEVGHDRSQSRTGSYTPAPSYMTLLVQASKLGFTDPNISIGYLGGFVARASSVGISLFIPLFVNAYFIRSGLCAPSNDNPTDIRENCDRAYKLAAALSGIAETAALICAPLFGWLGGRIMHGRSEWPLLGAAVVGVIGYTLFGFLKNPDAFHGEGGQWSFLAVILVGVGQIGAIVCSLSLVSKGVNESVAVAHRDESTEFRRSAEHPSQQQNGSTAGAVSDDDTSHENDHTNGHIHPGTETAPLLQQTRTSSLPSGASSINRSQLKGSIAGIYSFAGGAGILLLTKLGGILFDQWTPGAPFFMLAIFNAILAVAIILIGGRQAFKKRQKRLETDEAVEAGDS